jgi:hypothetical protein
MRMKKEHQSTGKRAVLLTTGWITCAAIIFKILATFCHAVGPAEALAIRADRNAVSIHQAESAPLSATPGQLPLEPTVPDEVESRDDCTDDINKLLDHHYPESFEILHAEERLLLNLKVSIDNRTYVSLIVLHHSWKSLVS